MAVRIAARIAARIAILAAVPLALAGCAGGGGFSGFGGSVITYAQQVTPYAPSFVRTAARSGEFYVQMFGQPFPQEVPHQAIAERIVIPQWLGSVAATTQPGEEVNTNFRAIIAFNPAFRGPMTDSACANPDRVPVEPPVAGIVRLAAAFCIGSRIGSYLVARQDGLDGPQDPRFAMMLNQAMQVLLPNRDPNRSFDLPWSSIPY